MGIWWQEIEANRRLGRLALAWQIILKHILNKCEGRTWIELIWFGEGTTTAQVESCNDLSGFQERRR
jgi:hypothetical protein